MKRESVIRAVFAGMADSVFSTRIIHLNRVKSGGEVMEIYVVKTGDTLYNIARNYGVSAARIQTDNGLGRDQGLVPGQALVILKPAETYMVRAGDTLYGIANAYGTTVMQLIQNNPELAENNALYSGKILTIRFEGEREQNLITGGYAYPFINRSVLRRALPYLTTLSVFAYGFRETGELIIPNDEILLADAFAFQTVPVLVLSAIDENGGFSSYKAKRLFQDIPLQNKVLDSVLEIMRQKGYQGMDADFEFVQAEDAEAYFNFLRNAQSRLSQNGFFLNTDLAPKTSGSQPGLLYEAHNYQVIGEISDTVFLMTYEWGYTFGPPMAVAPIDAVRSVVNYAVSVIPTEKIRMGIPNYAYDWKLPFIKGESRAYTLGNQSAVLRAMKYGADIQYDETAQSPWFEYWRNREKHVVWFEDARSILAKLKLAEEFKLPGIGYWNLMHPFAQNFATLNVMYKIQKGI